VRGADKIPTDRVIDGIENLGPETRAAVEAFLFKQAAAKK